MNTTYDRKMQEQKMTDLAITTLKSVAEHKNKVPTYPCNIVSMMDLVEETISVCRGEKVADFREVSRDTIRIHTRIPKSATLLPPGVPDNIENPKMSKLIITLLLTHPYIFGVRWIPDEGNMGSYLVISLKDRSDTNE